MLEKLILGVVVGALKYFADRYAQTNAAKAEVYHELWKSAKTAYEWEAAAARHDGGADLRVREQGGRIELQSNDPTVDRGAPPS